MFIYIYLYLYVCMYIELAHISYCEASQGRPLALRGENLRPCPGCQERSSQDLGSGFWGFSSSSGAFCGLGGCRRV